MGKQSIIIYLNSSFSLHLLLDSENKSITYLGLKANYIGDTGVKYISEGIKENKIISELDLEYNQIGDAGAK